MTGYEFCVGYWWIFPLVMIFFCFLFVRRNGGRGMCGFCGSRDFRDTPLDILNNRYAKGEIDQGEYEEKKRSIEDELKKQNSNQGENNAKQ